MFIGIALVLIIIWAVAVVTFHVVGFAIYILLILALISFIGHFFRGKKTQ
jgi:hypothetical protein